jgi:hypothetical protein
MIGGTLLFVIATYALMVWAFFWAKKRYFHIPVMASIMLIDLFFPVYLVLNKDWYRRLIEQEEILSFMIWMHFILVLVLYALYVLQILTARKLLKGDDSVRADHRAQGKGILIARALVILSAAMLIEPVDQ